MIPAIESLLKYDTPVLVRKHSDTVSPKTRSLKVSSQKAPPSGAAALPPMSRSSPDAQTQEILDTLLPPREWAKDGKQWVQHVSSTPCTRTDVVQLQEQMDGLLLQRHARETGICPVRRELYAQCFDELIRQVTINCAERGVFLLRVRDEIAMTVAAHETLYESSMTFGVRKALQAKWGKANMEARITQLQEEKRDLQRQIDEQKDKYEAVETRTLEQREMDEQKHTEELQLAKSTNQQLKAQLEVTISQKK